MNNLSYYAQVVVGNELWVSNIRFNGLFKIDLESGGVVFIGKFPRYDMGNEELHLFAKKYRDKIYFFPKQSKGIDIYDLKKGTFTYVECETDRDNGYATAINAFCFDENNVFVVPCYLNTPLQEFSLKKELIIRSIELQKSSKYVKNETNTRMLYACKARNEIFYPIKGTNKVGSYHSKEKKEKVYSIKGVKKILGDIVFDGKDFWINADQGIYQWNPYEGDLKFVCDCSSEKEGWIEQFIIYERVIICIPRWLNHIKIIDRQNFDQQEIQIDKSELNVNIDMSWRDVRESIIWWDTLIISPVKYKETIFVNLNNYRVVYKKWKFLGTSYINEGFFAHERIKEDLQDFITALKEAQ